MKNYIAITLSLLTTVSMLSAADRAVNPAAITTGLNADNAGVTSCTTLALYKPLKFTTLVETAEDSKNDEALENAPTCTFIYFGGSYQFDDGLDSLSREELEAAEVQGLRRVAAAIEKDNQFESAVELAQTLIVLKQHNEVVEQIRALLGMMGPN